MKKHFLIFLTLLMVASVFGQSNNLDTSNGRTAVLLKEMHDAVKWGLPTTNGIQLGVEIHKLHAYTYLYNETNFCLVLYPPNGYRLSLSLKDATGKEAEKTKEGKAITKSVDLIIKTQMKIRTGRIQGAFDVVPQKNPMRYEAPFNLLDCFEVEKPGTNTLTVGATICKIDNGGNLYEIVLPSVSVLVSITQADMDDYCASKKNSK